MTIDLLALLQRRQQAITSLKQAMDGIDDDAVCVAAAQARSLGIYDPGEIDWENVEQRESRAADFSSLRRAFDTGDDAQIARAYARVASLWPEYLSPESNKEGLVAFRRWGRALRQGATHNP